MNRKRINFFVKNTQFFNHHSLLISVNRSEIYSGIALYLLNLTRYVWRARANRLYRRLVSHYLCTNKKLHVNSVNSKTSRSINGVRGSDVGSNIELFVVGQHQLSCRPSCFNLRGSRTTMVEWSTSRDLNDSLSTDKWQAALRNYIYCESNNTIIRSLSGMNRSPASLPIMHDIRDIESASFLNRFS